MAHTILIVDDDKEIRTTLSAFLEVKGYRVVCAANGKEALRMVISKHPSLILMDITMPDLDGLNALELIRLSGAARNTPIIILTGTDNADAQEKGRRVGANDFLPKSTPFDEIASRVEHHLAAGKDTKETKAS